MINQLRKLDEAGLSLVEVLVAVFVVSVGTLGAVSALWYGIRSERLSERKTNAVFQARELVNVVRSRNLPFIGTNLTIGSPINDGDYDDDSDDSGPRQAFNAPPFDGPDGLSNDFNFQRRIEIKRLSDDPNSHRFPVVGIKVTLYWTEANSEKEVKMWAYHRQP